MRREEKARLDLGLRCCIQSARTHICPEECPYTDEVISGALYGCQGVLAMDAQMRIAEMERMFEIMRQPSSTRLLNRGEISSFVGGAWLEVWYEAEEDEPEYRDIMPVGVCMGNLAHRDGDFTDAKWLKQQYNKPYGMRLWVGGKPTEEQREATPWES